MFPFPGSHPQFALDRGPPEDLKDQGRKSEGQCTRFVQDEKAPAAATVNAANVGNGTVTEQGCLQLHVKVPLRTGKAEG